MWVMRYRWTYVASFFFLFFASHWNPNCRCWRRSLTHWNQTHSHTQELETFASQSLHARRLLCPRRGEGIGSTPVQMTGIFWRHHCNKDKVIWVWDRIHVLLKMVEPGVAIFLLTPKKAPTKEKLQKGTPPGFLCIFLNLLALANQTGLLWVRGIGVLAYFVFGQVFFALFVLDQVCCPLEPKFLYDILPYHPPPLATTLVRVFAGSIQIYRTFLPVPATLGPRFVQGAHQRITSWLKQIRHQTYWNIVYNLSSLLN